MTGGVAGLDALAMSAIDDALELACSGAADVFVSRLGARDAHAKHRDECEDDQRRNIARTESFRLRDAKTDLEVNKKRGRA